MLKRLTISNIALLDGADLEFDNGLTVITGETGAGKSVIVSALSLALGARADKEIIRHGEKSAKIEAVIDLSSLPKSLLRHVRKFTESNELIITRDINLKGGSKPLLNGEPLPLTDLRELTSTLAEIVGQHAGQELMNEDSHIAFLDRFAGLIPLAESVESLYQNWRELSSELTRTAKRKEQLKNERELLLFQKQEIEKADISIGEEESLSRELKILNSARSLMSSAGQIEKILNSEESSALEMIKAVRSELETMAQADSTLESKVNEATELEYQLEDIRQQIEQYANNIEDNPARIEEINARLDELYGLKKKYGGSEEGILNTLIEIDLRLADSPDVDSLIEKLEFKCNTAFEKYSLKAIELSDKRHRAAAKLEKKVIKELSELAIGSAGFELEFSSEDDPDGVRHQERTLKPQPYGLENCKILFSANPGEPLRSLVKTASGGEFSRVLLALKSAELSDRKSYQPIMVFDEVDVGIGGRTALAVGHKLKKLSSAGQVIVITHLHQIARVADHHFLAEKETEKNGRALIKVKQLEESAIGQEIDRMVSLPD